MPQILWDAGNWPKCSKHGLGKIDVESVFEGDVYIFDDPHPRKIETRMRAVGRVRDGRHVFVVFTMRVRAGITFIRPISARYMHKKEIAHHEREKNK